MSSEIKMLYHGSRTEGLNIIEPRISDHGQAFVYATENLIVAAIYLCNAVEKPYNWFPYGFNKDDIPVYNEYYPNAFEEVAKGVSGFLYEIKTLTMETENHSNNELPQAIHFSRIKGCYVFKSVVKTTGRTVVPDTYDFLMDAMRNGQFLISRYEDRTQKQLSWLHNTLLQEMKNMPQNLLKSEKGTPEYIYSEFVKKNFPKVWAEYEKSTKI